MKPDSIGLFAGVFACAVVGTILAAEAATYTEEVLYSFCSQQNCADGAYPSAGLIDMNRTLYGTTGAGGGGTNCEGGEVDGCGTVFALDPTTDAEKIVYSFCKRPGCADGLGPLANLIEEKGTLYGTTSAGGSGVGCGLQPGCGTVFSLDPSTGTEKVLHSFHGATADGAAPEAGLIDVDGILYGITTGGGGTGCGGYGCGTVFSLDPYTGIEKVLHSFAGPPSDGSDPWVGAGLIAVNGMLYGTTFRGGGSDCGSYGCGTVFSLDPYTGIEKVLYSFCSQSNCADGEYPEAGLIDLNGMLYGTTYAGGSTNCTISCGTVFSVDPSTGAETVVHYFLGGCKDGQWPSAGLIAVKGKVYGTTSHGGGTCPYAGGTVFLLDPNTGAEEVLYTFCQLQNCADGAYPETSLIDVVGALYGTTQIGGASCPDSGGCGIVFAVKKKR